MEIFNNQNNLRVNNQLKVLSILKKGETPLNDLATFLNVSHAAITKIINQLYNAKIVNKVVHRSKTKLERGRLPISIHINNSVGVVCAIAFAKNTEIAISNLTGDILVYKSFSTPSYITEAEFSKVKDIINELLKDSKINGLPLLSICISTPGMVQKETGDIYYSFKVKSSISPLTYFRNQFGVPTSLYNDVQISLVGAKKYDLIPSSASNYIYAHISGSCAVSFSFDGKLYQGFHGYPGEQTSFSIEDSYTNNSTSNILYGFTKIVEYASKVDSSYSYLKEGFSSKKDEIIKLFLDGNPTIDKVVHDTAIKNALQFIAYNDLLNLDHIIIDGEITKLGETYKKYLLDAIYKYKKDFKANIIFINSNINTSLLGAIYQAGNIYFLDKLEKLANQKVLSGKYSISDAFGDNI